MSRPISSPKSSRRLRGNLQEKRRKKWKGRIIAKRMVQREKG
jgi:hypothetical protein